MEPPILLDATETGWSKVNTQYDLIFLSNLLHLVSNEEAEILIVEISKALSPKGIAILYGPSSAMVNCAVKAILTFIKALSKPIQHWDIKMTQIYLIYLLRQV